MKKTETADIAVIGAGIMGWSVSYHLAKKGADVTLLERNSAVGLEASGVNAGSICIQNKPFNLIEMAMAAATEWQELSDEIGWDVGYHRVGGLRIAEDESQNKKLQLIAQRQREFGLPVEELTCTEVKELAPYLKGNIAGANYCALDGHADSLSATDRIARAAKSAGASVHTGCEILAITPYKDGYCLQTSQGTILARQVILSAGIWSREIANTLNVTVPLKVRVNQIMVTERMPRLIEHMITHVEGNLTLKQLSSGSIVIGGGMQGHGSLDDNRPIPSLKGLVSNAQAAQRIMPQLQTLQVIRSWAGFDGRTSDQLPIIGEIPGQPGMFLATSCFGGFVIGPLVGRLLAEEIVGETPAMPLGEFSYERYGSTRSKASTF